MANVAEAKLGEWKLADIEAFAGLEVVELRALELSTRVVDLPKGQWLFMEGDARRDVYCLVAGRIKISRLSRAGKEFILELVEPGEIFGESSLFEDGTHDADGIAFEDSRVVTLPSRELAKLMMKHADLPLRLARLLERRRKRMERRLVALALQKVRGRVASLLLQLCQDYGVPGIEGVSLGIDLRHQEIANLIGASREIVTHTLSDFRREGVIGSDGRTIVVRRPVALEPMVDVAASREESTS